MRPTHVPPRRRRGFSLIELAVVLVVLGVVISIAVPAFERVIERSEDHATVTELQAVVRSAAAIAAFDGRMGFHVDDVDMALSELSSHTVGVSAAQPWTRSDGTVEPGPGEVSVMIGPGNLIGLAAYARSGSCVLVYGTVAGATRGWVQPEPVVCTGETALEGPWAAPPPTTTPG